MMLSTSAKQSLKESRITGSAGGLNELESGCLVSIIHQGIPRWSNGFAQFVKEMQLLPCMISRRPLAGVARCLGNLATSYSSIVLKIFRRLSTRLYGENIHRAKSLGGKK